MSNWYSGYIARFLAGQHRDVVIAGHMADLLLKGQQRVCVPVHPRQTVVRALAVPRPGNCGAGGPPPPTRPHVVAAPPATSGKHPLPNYDLLDHKRGDTPTTKSLQKLNAREDLQSPLSPARNYGTPLAGQRLWRARQAGREGSGNKKKFKLRNRSRQSWSCPGLIVPRQSPNSASFIYSADKETVRGDQTSTNSPPSVLSLRRPWWP